MANLLVQGRDAETVLNRVCANDVSVPVGRIVYTQWCNEAGGIIADLTVTRLSETVFVLVVTDTVQRRMAPWIERPRTRASRRSSPTCRPRRHPDDRPGPAQPRAADPADQRGPLERRLPVLTAQEIDLDYARVLAMRVTYVGELRLGAPRPSRPGADRLRRADERGLGPRYRNVGMAALSSLRIEKAYRDLGRGHRRDRHAPRCGPRVRGCLGQAGRVRGARRAARPEGAGGSAEAALAHPVPRRGSGAAPVHAEPIRAMAPTSATTARAPPGTRSGVRWGSR